MHLAWPIGVSMISYSFKGVLDSLMVGHLGTDALAAVGVAGVLAFNVIAFPMGVLRGQKSLVSQYLGAGRSQESFRFGIQAFYLAAAFSLLFLFLAGQAGSIFALISHGSAMRGESILLGQKYLGWRIGCSAPTLMALAVGEYLRATGRTRLPMVADLISHPLNLLFNYALIFGNFGAPKMGVVGAAIGTGLAETVCLVLLLIFPALTRKGKLPAKPFRFEWVRFRRVLSVGTASGVQFTLEVGSFSLITFMISRYLGSLSTAVHQAAIQVIHFSFLPAVAVGDGGSVLIGRFVGMKRYDLVQRTVRSMLQLIVPLMVAMGLVFLLAGQYIAAPFIHNEDPELQARGIALGGALLAVAAVWQLGDAFQIVYRFSLRAAGDHQWVMWAGVSLTWVLSVPLAWTAMQVFGGDVNLVWLMWSGELYLGAWVFRRRWKSGAWRRKRLVQASSEEEALPELNPPPSPEATLPPAAS